MLRILHYTTLYLISEKTNVCLKCGFLRFTTAGDKKAYVIPVMYKCCTSDY